MKKKLYRNTEEKLVAGVLSGLADYYESNVVMWRLGFIVALILGFVPGVLVYFIAWVIIPEKPKIVPLDKTDYTVYQ